MRAAAHAHGVYGMWIANDWVTLPLAAECVDRHGGLYVYDSHEFAIQEYSERLDWALLHRPLVATIEERFIRGAAVVTSVSPEITKALKQRYQLAAPTATLRNMPTYREHAFRPTPEKIEILYHGVLYYGRGLEETIVSVRDWREEFTFTIRGPGPAEYLRKLENLANTHGVSSRVRFEAPVPASELVAKAIGFDVGMMVLRAHSQHNSYALPNKVFEYMMAGLALCVSDLPSMAAIVRQSGAGVLVEEPSAHAIARTVNGLTRSRIDANEATRAASLKAPAFRGRCRGCSGALRGCLESRRTRQVSGLKKGLEAGLPACYPMGEPVGAVRQHAR